MNEPIQTCIRVLLVDDHQLMLEGLNSLLSEKKDIVIVGLASSAEEALKMIEAKRVDVLVADIHLPGMNGIVLTKKINELHSEVKVIALTMHNESSLINQMVGAGASGYVIKSNRISELLDAIRAVAAGDKYLSKEVQSIIMDNVFRPDDAIQQMQPDVAHLTRREVEILGLIAREHSNKDIADKLFISERTVETHRKNIFTKTKTKTIVGLIKYAIENDLIRE